MPGADPSSTGMRVVWYLCFMDGKESLEGPNVPDERMLVAVLSVEKKEGAGGLVENRPQTGRTSRVGRYRAQSHNHVIQSREVTPLLIGLDQSSTSTSL